VVILPAEQMEPTKAARWMRGARPSNDGRFQIRGARPGRYVAVWSFGSFELFGSFGPFAFGSFALFGSFESFVFGPFALFGSFESFAFEPVRVRIVSRPGAPPARCGR
jgi:hypothetical protein